jgi:4-amino-4-deoxy-L-arabinose transferase-like glycosyltransferase
MTTASLPNGTSFLKKNLFLGITPATVIMIAILLFSLALHLYNIERIGDANAYYTAAVESMLKSWHNFFFVAAEPGGSVTVDKPPLGLWIEAVFAYFLGVSGFSVSLPNIIAGVLGIPLLYGMARKYLGELAGIVAALVMAMTPVFVATNRNNTMDGLLVFFLLLAAWAFIKATESGRLRWVLLGAFIVGLGFNIKMLQAFLPLPAFYALYFLGSKEGWLRKLLNLGIATILLLAVSLSWAVAVDLTPADQRPYIGSSGDNTVMELILGHNGTSRLFGGFFGTRGTQQDGGNGQVPQDAQIPPQGANLGGPPRQAITACEGEMQGASCSFDLPNRSINGTCITPPDLDQLVCAPQGGLAAQNGGLPGGGLPQGPNAQGGGTQFSQETGEPGLFRFFTQPLSKQMSWLLPFALISLALPFFGSRIRLPLESGAHKSLVLWGGWLVTCLVFFSAISGIFHSYYAIMLAPALGAVAGMGFAQLWEWGKDHIWAAFLLMIAALVTLAFQVFASSQYNELTVWLPVAGAALLIGGIVLVPAALRRLGYVLILMSMLVVPVYWTTMTVATNPNQNLPTAYQGTQQTGPNQDDRARDAFQPGGGQSRRTNKDSELLAYLEENTQDVEYLVAVPSSQNGATMVLRTGRPVLYMGGFSGQDEVVTAEDLSEMVANAELRYVLYGGDRGGKQEIANWLQSSCTSVPEFSQTGSGNPIVQGPPGGFQQDAQNRTGGPQGSGDQAMTLYICE